MIVGGYLFDTDALSFVIKRRLHAYPAYARLLRTLPRASQYTCAPVIGELYAGAHRLTKPEPLMQRIGMTLARLTILPFDRAAAEIYGTVRATSERRGEPLADMDLCIAACAIAHDVTLITGNARHFFRISGLSVWVVTPSGVNEMRTAYRTDLPPGPDAATLADETGAAFADDDARIRGQRR